MTHPAALLPGEVVAAHGRQYRIRLADGTAVRCVTRGKKSDALCGDQVEIKMTSPDQGVIERILPRTSLLYRADAWRSKAIAANVTQVVLVLAAEPSPNEELLGRCLLAVEAGGMKPLIVFNKMDVSGAAAALERFAHYRQLGYALLTLSAKQGIEPLRPLLHGHRSVLVGQSGMGKSTIINALVPDARAQTAEFSTALDSGKHTTTHATLYPLDESSSLIDSPGLQSFGLKHIPATELAHLFPEMRPSLGQCRFYNCTHQHEPGCAVLQSLADGRLRPERHRLYRQVWAENSG